MRNVLICTVGTSLKGNLARAEDRRFGELLAGGNVKGLSIALSEVESEDRLAGAEINSITSILKKGLLEGRDYLYLLVSDTEDGNLVGAILKAYYRRGRNPLFFQNVHMRVIKGLSDDSPHRFRTEGLRNLVKAIAEIVRRHGSPLILINATGGYKAQISFAGMIGQALEIPVCYLFERFSEVIELPPQPVSLDLTFWLEHADLFFDLARDEARENPTEKDERFSSLVDEIGADGEKIIGLSPTGQLFHEAFQYRFSQQKKALLPQDSSLAPEEKIIKYEDGNRGRHRGLQAYLERICRLKYVTRIQTYYHNPDLPLKNYFRLPARGDITCIEGGYSDGKGTTKFTVVTTAGDELERKAAMVDLNDSA